MYPQSVRGWDIFWNVLSAACPLGFYAIEKVDEVDRFKSDEAAFEHIIGDYREATACIRELLKLATDHRRESMELRQSLQEAMAINDRQTAARHALPAIPERYCPTHGHQPNNVWACPECFIEMRKELRLPGQEEEVVLARVNVGHFASLVEEELRADGYYDKAQIKEAAARIAKLARLHYLRITPTSHKE